MKWKRAKTGDTIDSLLKKVKTLLYNDFDKVYWVDTITALSFWPVMMTINEVYLQDLIGQEPLEWNEVGLARTVGIPLGMLTARPILNIRDFWQEKVFKVKPGQLAKEKIADFTLVVPIITGVYGVQIAPVADSMIQFLTTVAAGTAVQVGMAFVYLPLIKKIRQKFGTTPEYVKKAV